MDSACQLTQMIVVVQGDTFTVRGDATNANDLYVLVAPTGLYINEFRLHFSLLLLTRW